MKYVDIDKVKFPAHNADNPLVANDINPDEEREWIQDRLRLWEAVGTLSMIHRTTIASKKGVHTIPKLWYDRYKRIMTGVIITESIRNTLKGRAKANIFLAYVWPQWPTVFRIFGKIKIFIVPPAKSADLSGEDELAIKTSPWKRQ